MKLDFPTQDGSDIDWFDVTDFISQKLEIPDLSTQTGSAQASQDFNTLYKKLVKCYSDSTDSPVVQIGVAAIMSSMCLHADLCRKLHAKDFLSKITPLLKKSAFHYVTVQIVCKIAVISLVHKHGYVVSKGTLKPLLALLQDQIPDPASPNHDVRVIERAFATIGTLLEFLLLSPHADLHDCPVDMPGILDISVQIMKSPDVTLKANFCALHLLSKVAKSPAHHQYLETHSSALNLLIATLKSSNINTRLQAINILFHITRGSLVIEPSRFKQFDFDAFMDASEKTQPARIRSAIGNDSNLRSMKVDHDALDFAMAKLHHNLDYRAFALTLYPMLLKSEMHALQAALSHGGLAFTGFFDSLPHCANVLRYRGDSADVDIADAFDLKYSSVASPPNRTHQLADKCIKRNSKNPFFYYMKLGCVKDYAANLSPAKQGLKCVPITRFLRLSLLRAAAIHAFGLGYDMIVGAKTQRDWDLGRALLRSSLQDSDRYIASAPNDDFDLWSVLLLYIMVYIMYHGAELKRDLQLELKDKFDRLKIVDEVHTFFWGPSEPTKERAVIQLITPIYAAANAEWAETTSRLNSESPNGHRFPDEALQWTSRDVKEEDNTLGRLLGGRPRRVGSMSSNSPPLTLAVDVDDSILDHYLCSWCSTPSAMLRVCSACGKTRYCDVICQKRDWAEGHKAVCKH